jgi:hypothetical protein
MSNVTSVIDKIIGAQGRAVIARALWTGVASIVAYFVATPLNIPPAYAPIAAFAFSAIKSWVATKIGNGNPTFSATSIEAPTPKRSPIIIMTKPTPFAGDVK